MRRASRTAAVAGVVLGVLLAGGRASADTSAAGLNVFTLRSGGHAWYVANVSQTQPNACIQVGLNRLNVSAPGGHWAGGGYYLHGAGVVRSWGNLNPASTPLGTLPLSSMTVRLYRYQYGNPPPASATWALKARLSTGKWVALGTLPSGTWTGLRHDDLVVPQSVINDLNARPSKVINLGCWTRGSGDPLHLGGLRVFGQYQAVPEPSTLALLGTGILGLLGALRKRRTR